MADELITTVLTRRRFLRASSLIAIVLGLGATVFAQEAAKPGQEPNRQPEEKPDAPPDSKPEQKPDAPPDDKPDDGSSTQSGDETRETKVDENGREYRICPVCGANMYKTGTVYACEFCDWTEPE